MRKFLKITGWIVGSIILLVLLALLWLQTGSGKNFVRDRALAFLRGKLKTEVYISRIDYRLPKMLELDGLLVKDQAKDTLLAAGKLRVDMNMLALISGKVVVQQLELEGVSAHVYRHIPDTNFNFTYIIKAFTGTPSKEPEKEELKKANDTSSLSFDVDKVKLSHFHIRFDDYTGGSRLSLQLDSLFLTVKKLNPATLDFGIKKLYVTGLTTGFYQDTSYLPAKPKDTTTTVLHLAAEELDLHRIGFVYKDNLSKMLMDIQLGHLNALPRNIDLLNQQLQIDALSLDSSKVVIAMGRSTAQKDTVQKKADTAAASKGWHVQAGKIHLAAIDFRMDDESKPKAAAGMDYAHLNATGLALDASKLLYTADTISGNLAHLAVQEQSGLQLQELKTAFIYHPQGATLNGLYLKTDKTLLQKKIEIRYPSLAALQKEMQRMQLSTDITGSYVGMQDVLLFAPDLAKQPFFAENRNAVLSLEAVLNGYMSAIAISSFRLAGLRNTSIALNGRLNGLPDANKLNYDLNIQQLRSAARDINPFLPASLQRQIRIPEVFSITGHVSGTTKDYNTRLALGSTSGNAVINGYIHMSPGKNRETYDLDLRTERLNLGYILRQDTLLGPVTAGFLIKGRSFDMATMTASVKGQLKAAYVKGYTYNSISLDGHMDNKTGGLVLTAADPNLRLKLEATADLHNKYPAVVADLNIDSIDLHALKLYEQELKASTRLHADFPVLNADYPDGTLTIYRPRISHNGQQFLADSIYLSSKPTADSSQNIQLQADMLYAAVTGHAALTKIGGYVQEHITRHYALGDTTKKSRADSLQLASDYDLQFLARITDRPLLHVFAPDLKSMDTVRIAGNLNQRDLNLDLAAPGIVYGDNVIKGVAARLRGTDSSLNYNVAVGQFSQPSIELRNTTLAGILSPQLITARLNAQDTNKKDRFALSASLARQDSVSTLSLGNDFLLNYKPWTVKQPNKIVFGPQGFYAQDFEIRSNDASISINSETPQFNAPLVASINNFLLADVTQIISKGDTLLANGLLSGTVNLKQIKPQPLLEADLKIRDLSVLNDTIGNLALQASNRDANAIAANLSITGQGNDVSLTGDYYMNPVNGDNFNMQLAMKALSIKSMEGLAMRQIRNSSGFMRGNLSIKGSTGKPLITGELKTDQLKTTVSTLNAPFSFPAEQISFTPTGIQLNKFNIVDSAGNKLTLDGSLDTRDFSNMRIDMNVAANRFKAMSSTAADNKNFYGDVLVTTNINISGPIAVPNIDGSLRILKGTKFTMVLPEKEVNMQDTKGIVEFISNHNPNARILVTKAVDTTPKLAMSPGSDINVNIGIEPEAEFSVIIDAATGDFLKIRGEASLNASISPGGELALTGIYELREGAYQLNYNLIKRTFNIQSGSTISFAGDPLQANMDITAVYNANIPPYDLIEKQVPDPAQLNYYKQRLPFEVHLLLKGELMQPLINFDVLLPEGKSYRLSGEGVELVQAKLAQVRTDTAELNKQVFAVLLLNRFVGDDPFSSGAGSNVNSVARQSVSRFISEQLNQYANSLLKGVDVSFDLASSDDYTTGERRDRTDLNVNVSKRLLNDRLTLTVGNNFELEGPQTNSGNASGIPGNLVADYKLSSDGRYSVNVYRKTQDAGVLEGFVTETGVNFIVTLDYNRFKNLFNKKQRQRQREKERKQREQSQNGKEALLPREEREHHSNGTE